jgi:hypothetical protein
MGPLQLMQGLAGAAHKGLALGLRQLCVVPVLRSELLKQLQLVGRKPRRGLTQTAPQERLKRFTPALQIAEAPISLELKPLLEGAQPVLKAQA